jgi:hypothetical protein
MRAPGFTKIFLPQRFFIGLGSTLVGLLVLAGVVLYFLNGNGVKLSSFAIGPAITLFGVVLAASSRATACAACREEIAKTHLTVPLQMDALVRSAVLDLQRGLVDGMVALHTAPSPPPNAPTVSSVEIEYCAKCHTLARVSSSRRQSDGAAAGPSHTVVVTGPIVVQVVNLAAARNEASRRAVFGRG